ncbi:hypothetical protein [Salinibacter altiplanensis]|uniref:hypothetical protein n=1 Tax=Salinibacter altiplanensis TaxID=1803181 RepID=UPI00131A5E82|nr:hypothetical protein [Salinibacter altiplanensis]
MVLVLIIYRGQGAAEKTWAPGKDLRIACRRRIEASVSGLTPTPAAEGLSHALFATWPQARCHRHDKAMDMRMDMKRMDMKSVDMESMDMADESGRVIYRTSSRAGRISLRRRANGG